MALDTAESDSDLHAGDPVDAGPGAPAALLDALDLMVLHVAPDGRLAHANAAARRLLAHADGVPAVRVDATLRVDGLPALRARVAGEARVARDHVWHAADGTAIPVRVTAGLARVAGDERLVLAAVRRGVAPAPADVARPLAPAYRLLLECASFPAMIQDADHRVVAVNEAFCQLVGRPADELTGIDPTFLMPADTLDHVRAQRERIARTLALDDAPVAVDRAVVLPDGSRREFHVRVRALPDSRGGTCFLVLADDPAHAVRGEAEVIRDRDVFRLLFEESPAPLIMQAADFRILAANRAYAGLVGRAPSEIVGRDPIEWYAPQDRELILEQRARARRGEHLPASVTRRMHRADGSVRVCRVLRHTTVERSGARIDLVMLHDETEEIRMQQRLREYWQRFERFFEQAPVGLMISDASGSIVQVNRMLEEILGRSRELLVGAPDALVDPETDGHPSGRRVRIAWRRDDGGLRWLDRLDRELENLDGRPARLTALHDVTRERTLRDELQETEARFRQFAELVDDAIFVADARLERVDYVNGRFEAIWGVPAAAFAERPSRLFEPVLPQHLAAIRGLFDASAPGRARDAVVELRHPGLGTRSVRLRVYDRHDRASGRPDGTRVFAVAEDVTELLRLQQQRLDEALAQRDMLVREVHHRIKNNLQGVAGLLQQSASSRPELAGPLAEVAGRIQAIAQVHGLQVRGGEAVGAARVVSAVVDNLARAFGREVRLAGGDDPRVVRWVLPDGEAVPIALVVNELGTNAIKHGGPGAPVRVSLRGGADGLELELSNPGRLPVGFDLASLGASASGLGLVVALMPRRGASLALEERDGEVVARVRLVPPVLVDAGGAR